MFDDISRGIRAHTVAPTTATLDEQVPIRLRDHVQKLRIIVPVLSVSILALKRQAAELDDDIASVLHMHALDPLDRELEQLDELLESIAASKSAKEGGI